MPNINIDSILEKAKAHMNTPKRQKEILKKTNDAALNGSSDGSIRSIYEAASKFIYVLRKEIESSGLSAEAMDAISQINYTSAVQIGDGKYMIGVYFAGDLSRPSLNTEKYDGIDNIVLLFNNGVDHKMRPVYGKWHGRETWSRTVIPGTYFMQSAVRDFMSNYASEYNVVDIIANGEDS